MDRNDSTDPANTQVINNEIIVVTEDQLLKKRNNWTDGEIRSLLEIWPNYRKYLEKSSAKGPIFERMSEELQRSGVNRDPAQIQKKMQKLRAEFRAANMTKTGAGPKEWPYLHEMRQITAGDHFFNRELVNELETSSESINVTSTAVNDQVEPRDEDDQPRRSRKRKLQSRSSPESNKRYLRDLTESMAENQKTMITELQEMKNVFMKVAEKYLSDQ